MGYNICVSKYYGFAIQTNTEAVLSRFEIQTTDSDGSTTSEERLELCNVTKALIRDIAIVEYSKEDDKSIVESFGNPDNWDDTNYYHFIDEWLMHCQWIRYEKCDVANYPMVAGIKIDSFNVGDGEANGISTKLKAKIKSSKFEDANVSEHDKAAFSSGIPGDIMAVFEKHSYKPKMLITARYEYEK